MANYYGYFRAEKGLEHEDAIKEVMRLAKGLVKAELERFLELRKREGEGIDAYSE